MDPTALTRKQTFFFTIPKLEEKICQEQATL